MENMLNKSIIVITGGASGIGLSTALAVKKNGGLPIVFDVNPAGIMKENGITAIKVDVSKEKEVEDAFRLVEEKYGLVYGLVNNAAMSPSPEPADNISREVLLNTFAVNVFGAFYCTKYAVRQMLNLGRGSVVNISSVIGKVGSKNTSIYASSKAALIGMTKSDAITYASRNIRFNAVLPGYVMTPLIKNNADRSGNAENYYSTLKSLHPVGRLADPNEIAEIILFLLSENSSFITGSEIVIDGGYTSV